MTDREGGADGALGIVLVGGGRAEQRHDRVADELLDGAAEALQLPPQPNVVRSEPSTYVFGVHLLGLRGRADDVGEQDGANSRVAIVSRSARSERGARWIHLASP